MVKVYEYVDSAGGGVITGWELQKRERIKLLQKIHVVAQQGFAAAGLIGGPNIGKQRHIYKLKVKGSVQLRPMFCRGPFDLSGEITFLAPATERDGSIDPASAPMTAEFRRRQLLNGTAQRVRIDT